MTREQENAIMDLLWDYLKRDPEDLNRRQTGWSTKTKLGLCACIERIGKGDLPPTPFNCPTCGMSYGHTDTCPTRIG